MYAIEKHLSSRIGLLLDFDGAVQKQPKVIRGLPWSKDLRARRDPDDLAARNQLIPDLCWEAAKPFEFVDPCCFHFVVPDEAFGIKRGVAASDYAALLGGCSECLGREVPVLGFKPFRHAGFCGRGGCWRRYDDILAGLPVLRGRNLVFIRRL